MIDRLVEIPVEKWPQLRDLYAEHKDRASCYNTIQTFIDWIKKEPSFPLKIYSLNGTWETDGGTYVVESNKQVFCNTLNNDLTHLINALNCIDPFAKYTVGGFQERVLPAVEKHFSDAGLTKKQYMMNGTYWYYISRDEALKFDIEPPTNISIKSLDECHAEQINSIWPHRSNGSVVFVKTLIKLGKTVGLFEGDKLVAWCLRLPLGALGLLQVEQTYKRRGLGKLAVRCMSRYLAENGIEVTAPVIFENIASRSMFEQLGFKVIDKVYWAMKMVDIH